MELNEFFEKITKSYNLNHKMTQIIKSEEENKKHTKWMLKEMEIHNTCFSLIKIVCVFVVIRRLIYKKIKVCY